MIGIERVMKPWYVWRPWQLARRARIGWSVPAAGCRPLPVAWGAGRAGRWARMGAVVAACLLVLAPWMIRNASTFDRFVPISTNDATVAAGANCDLTYHGVDLGGWTIACISKRSERDESVQAAKWRREGIDYAKDHAGRLPVVAAIRFLRVWDFWQPRRQVEFAEEGFKLRYELDPFASFDPDTVLEELDADIKDVQEYIQELEHEVMQFSDESLLKAWVKAMRREVAAMERREGRR